MHFCQVQDAELFQASFTYIRHIFKYICTLKKTYIYNMHDNLMKCFNILQSLHTSIRKVCSSLYKTCAQGWLGFISRVSNTLLDSWGRWLIVFTPWHRLFHRHWWQTWPLPRADTGSRKSCISWSLHALFSNITYREKIPCLYH